MGLRRYGILCLLLGATMGVQAQSLRTIPAPGKPLSNPLDLTIVVEGQLETYDWERIRVVVDGTDVSTLALTALAAPLTLALPKEQFLSIEQTIGVSEFRIRLSGVTLPRGPHQVSILLPGKGIVSPLKLESSFLVL